MMAGGTGKEERRGGKRLEPSIPVSVKWQEANGEQVERAEITEMSERGLVLDMNKCPAPGTKITIINTRSNRTGKGQVIRGGQVGTIFWVVVAMVRWKASA